MKKLLLNILLVSIVGFVNAQISGIKNIPGDYPTIQAAIAAVNALGVGSGGVFFEVAADHKDTLTNATGGLITATGTATDSIVFRKNPSTTGENPRITAFTPGTSTTTDGIIKIAGGDYILFDGIDLQENATNNTATKQMEWGYALVKKQNTAPFNGCQHVTIKNCTITLNKTNTASVGIYSGNHIPTATTQLAITQTTDACNYLSLDSNAISNVYSGIKLNGYAAGSPFSLYDHFNGIGVNGKNTISDFGGSNSAAYGIYVTYQDSVRIVNDSIVGGTGTNSLLAGIHFDVGTSASAEIAGNYVSVTRAGTSTSGVYGIWNKAGGTPAQNLISIHDNLVKDCSYTGASAVPMYGIYNNGGAAEVRIYNNEITGSALSGAGTSYLLRSDASGTLLNVYNNYIHDNANSAAAAMTGIYSGSFPTTNVYSNRIANCTSTGGTVYGIYTTTGTTTGNIYRNTLNNISSNNGSTASCLVYGIYNQGAPTANIYNNFISGLYADAGTNAYAICGLYLTGGSTTRAWYNTVYLNASSSGSTFGSAALYASTTPTLDLRNNILVNVSVPGSSGFTVAYRRSGTALTNYSSNSNYNCFYAGTPGTNNLIYFNGTIPAGQDSTITLYKLRVTPRDAQSFSENPPFVQVTSLPYNVHLSTSTPTFCEGGAATVTTPAITDDYDGDARYPNPGYPDHPSYPASAPDVGADEFGGIRNDLTPPVITCTPLRNTSSFSDRTLTATITDTQSGVPTALPGLPVLHWKINDAVSWNSAVSESLGSGQYRFTFGSGVILADVVYYFICAQDGFLIPNVGVIPSSGADGFSADPPACSTPPTEPYAYRIVGTLAGGDYKIGGQGSTPGTGCTYVDITQAFADVNNVVDHIVVTNGGSGYSSFSTYVTISGGGGSGALATADVDEFGAVSGIRVTRNGDGYYKAPTVTITGAGTGAAAVAYIGAGKEITGHINFVIDTSYNWLEENYFPVHLEPVVGSGPTKTITLKPAPQTSDTLYSFSGAGFLKLNGVDYFTLDGSNNGTDSRDLTIRHLTTGYNCATIWIASASDTDGATHVTIKNCIIKGADPSTNMYAGIFSGGTASIESDYLALSPNSYNTIENNLLCYGRNAIVCLGKSTSELDQGLVISDNEIGTAVPGEGFTNQGIFIEHQDGGVISGNDIQNVIYNGQYNWVAGIYLSNSKNMNVLANKIHNLQQSLNQASFYVDGIYQTAAAFNTSGNPSTNTYANNVIYDLYSKGSGSYYNVIGLHDVKGWGDKFYYNTVHLSGQLNQAGLSNGAPSACFSNGLGLNSSYVQNIEVKNNILYITGHNASGTSHQYAHYAALTDYTGSALDYNLLLDSVTGTAIGHVGRFNNANQDDIYQWRSATLRDIASLSLDPLFTSATDLTPQSGSPVIGAGVSIPGITTDITGAPRDALHPTLGAYEVSTGTVKQWDGSESSDWNTGANWTPEGVPSSAENVTIPAATPNSCVLNATGAQCNNLLIASGATLTMQTGSTLTVSGDLTIQNSGTLNNNGTLHLEGDLVNQNISK